MADRNRYEDRERRRYDQDDDRGFFDEVRDWFSQDEPNRDRNRERERDRSYNQRRDWERDRWNDWDQNRQSNWYRDNERNLDRDWNRSQGDWDRNRSQDYDRDRWQDWGANRGIWEQDWDRDRQTRWGEGRQQGWGTNQERSWNRDWGNDWDRGRQGSRQYDRDRNYDRSTFGDQYGWNYDRGWDSRQRYDRQDYGVQDDDRQQNRWGRGDRTGTAGMRSDYGSDYDYENDFSRNRRRRGQNQNRGYEQGYVGYDREGAFYQDLDEPYSYEYWEVWMIPGEYTGFGPESYQRSDERIKEDICERLTRHGRIDARNIDIDVHEGEVVLKGSVPSRDMKRMAEDTAESVTGQKDVRNEIRVDKETRQNFQGTNRAENFSSQTGTATTSTTGRATTGRGSSKRSQLREGMEVIGKNGKVVGRVKEIRDRDFLVDRDMARDVYVPFDAVDSIGAQAMLQIASEEVDNQDWKTPDLM